MIISIFKAVDPWSSARNSNTTILMIFFNTFTFSFSQESDLPVTYYSERKVTCQVLRLLLITLLSARSKGKFRLNRNFLPIAQGTSGLMRAAGSFSNFPLKQWPRSLFTNEEPTFPGSLFECFSIFHTPSAGPVPGQITKKLTVKGSGSLTCRSFLFML